MNFKISTLSSGSSLALENLLILQKSNVIVTNLRDSGTGWDEILPQTGITRINVRSPDPARHENSIDLRDELQQVIVRASRSCGESGCSPCHSCQSTSRDQ
jgi:hypothetical protein